MTRLKAALVEATRPPLIVGALAVAVFVAWAANNGGFDVTSWFPGALFFLGLLIVSILGYGRAMNASRATALATAFISAYALWSVASIAWSHARGVAWEGGNRTLLYAIVYALFALLPWRGSHVAALASAFGVGVAVIGFVDVARAATGNSHRFFLGGRLIAPAGYVNASCALFILAAWPLAYLGARRELSSVLRGAFIGVVVVLADLALLTQSRASLVAIPVALVVYLLLVPQRMRALLALVPVAGGTASAAHWLLAPYRPLTHGSEAFPELRGALVAIVASGAAAAASWTVIALFDRRVRVPQRIVSLAGRGLLGLALAGLVAGLALFLLSSPGRRIHHAWHQFKSGYSPATKTSSHFTSGLGNNRYDFWRVALLEFGDHPVAGVGADNFAEDYVRERRSAEEPLYPHSLELRVLAQTGIVGGILFIVFLVSSVAAAVPLLRSPSLGAGVARAATAATAYWAIHGSIDWFWEFPALTAPSIAWLAMAASLAQSGRLRAAPAVRPAIRRSMSVVAVVVCLATGASFLFPFAAAEFARRAASEWRDDPSAAFRDLSRARRFDPFSPDPDLLAGAIASRLDQIRRMRRSFEEALARDPHQWYAHFELALAYAAARNWRRASIELDRAQALDPREATIGSVRRLVLAHRPIDRTRIDLVFIARVRRRIGR